MAKFATGIFVPKNVTKYVGKGSPRYRSGWELVFMNFCDNNPSVLYWASESLSIPYRSPLDGKTHQYIPDFFVVYQNKAGKKIAEIVEIKPKKQSVIEGKASAGARMVVAVNHAKWQSATAYCKYHGYTFRVITEDDLFFNGKQKK